MKLTRRHFLAASALVAGSGVVAAGATAYRWWDQPPSAPFRALSADEAAFFDALAEAIFPAGGDPPLGGRDANVARYVDDVVAGLAPTQAKLLRLAVHAFDNLPRASAGARFSVLPVGEAQAVMRGWIDSPVFEIRGIFQSFYIFTAMAYLAHPKVAPTLAPMFTCGFGP